MIEVKTNTCSLENATGIASALIESGLVAAVNIAEIKSVYVYEGQTRFTSEFALTIKSISQNYQEVEKIIIQKHKYKLPAIYAVNVELISAEYQRWVMENSSRFQDDHVPM